MAALDWNGNVILEAPRHLEAVLAALVRASARPVSGILGPRDQVVAARDALGLGAHPAYSDATEDLFALELSRLRVPDALVGGRVACRAPRPEELAPLAAWRQAYRVEALGERPGEALLAKCREELERAQREAKHWVVVGEGDELLAYAAFNAAIPECVQVGGVFTPPALRGRGHGRAVVAGALLEARRRGAERSVLFTETGNAPAQAAYRALGYERVGDYGMVLFEHPQWVGTRWDRARRP